MLGVSQHATSDVNWVDEPTVRTCSSPHKTYPQQVLSFALEQGSSIVPRNIAHKQKTDLRIVKKADAQIRDAEGPWNQQTRAPFQPSSVTCFWHEAHISQCPANTSKLIAKTCPCKVALTQVPLLWGGRRYYADIAIFDYENCNTGHVSPPFVKWPQASFPVQRGFPTRK